MSVPQVGPWEKPWPPEGVEHLGRCPVCARTERTLLHDDLADFAFAVAPGRWTMWRCTTCGSGYLDPRPAPSHIGLAYKDYYTHAAVPPDRPAEAIHIRLRKRLVDGYLDARFARRPRRGWRLGAWLVPLWPARRTALDHRRRHLPPLPAHGARLLDVGCGNGAFLREARDLGWDVAGVEPDPLAAELARAGGFEVRTGGIERYAGEAGKFAAITLNHVIEHLSDPRTDLAACRRLLTPAGMLFVETPNVNAAGHVLWGPAWRGLEPPRHLQLFARRALYGLLARTGFTAIRDLPHPDPSPSLDVDSAAIAQRSALPQAGSTPASAHSDPDTRAFLCFGAERAG